MSWIKIKDKLINLDNIAEIDKSYDKTGILFQTGTGDDVTSNRYTRISFDKEHQVDSALREISNYIQAQEIHY